MSIKSEMLRLTKHYLISKFPICIYWSSFVGMTISDLKNINYIERVIIHSLDLALYHVSVIIEGKEFYVYGNNDLPLKARSKNELQTIFEKFNVGSTYLRASSAYDEMIGQPIREQDNTLEVALGDGLKCSPTKVREH